MSIIIKLGDIVEVMGTNDEWWYGEIVGINGKQYDIYYIENKEDNRWEFNEMHDFVEKESINDVSRTKKGDYFKAWAKFDFRYLQTTDEQGNCKQELYRQEFDDGHSSASESLDSCHSWSTSDADSDVSDLIDDSPDNALEKV